jgi:hypothetical protein
MRLKTTIALLSGVLALSAFPALGVANHGESHGKSQGAPYGPATRPRAPKTACRRRPKPTAATARARARNTSKARKAPRSHAASKRWPRPPTTTG